MPSLQGEIWDQLTKHLTSNYESPDLQGMWIVLCTYESHYYLEDIPVWLLVIGSPGAGKTELAINILKHLPKVVAITELTVNSFLSGFKENIGILKQLKSTKVKGVDVSNGIFAFSDLTSTLLSKDEKMRNDIVGDMRRIYDGSIEKHTGNKPKPITWTGKVTCIGAVTQAIEKMRKVSSEMGERWLSMQWKIHNNYTAYALKAMRQVDNESKIQIKTQELITELLGDVPKIISERNHEKDMQEIYKYTELIVLYASFIEKARTQVIMDSSHRIVRIIPSQIPTRVAKGLTSLIRASMVLRRGKTISQVEIDMLKRLALDSLSPERHAVIEPLLKLYPHPLSRQELYAQTGYMSEMVFKRMVKELIALEIIIDSNKGRKLLTDELNINDLSESDTKNPSKLTLNSHFFNVLSGKFSLNSTAP